MKNETIIKKPKGSGSGNISITIENKLKSINVANPIPKKRKRKKRKAVVNDEDSESLENSRIEDMLRGGGGGAPLKDVSFIRPPSNIFTVWRDTLDSYNTSVPMNLAQQMGSIGPPAPPAPPPAPPIVPITVNTQPAIGNDGSTMREFMLAMTALQNNGYNRKNRIGFELSDALDDIDLSSMSVSEQNSYIKSRGFTSF